MIFAHGEISAWKSGHRRRWARYGWKIRRERLGVEVEAELCRLKLEIGRAVIWRRRVLHTIGRRDRTIWSTLYELGFLRIDEQRLHLYMQQSIDAARQRYLDYRLEHVRSPTPGSPPGPG